MVQDTSIQSFTKLHPAALGMRMLGHYLRRTFFYGGSTDQEMARIFGIAASTVSGIRGNQLVKHGLVEKHIKRPCSIMGNVVWAWRITDKGRDLLAGRVPEKAESIQIQLI